MKKLIFCIDKKLPGAYHSVVIHSGRLQQHSSRARNYCHSQAH